MQSEFKEAYDPGSHYRVAVIPFKEVLGERARLTLWLLMGAAAFVMIISAANVVNLTLMRGVRREHELVVRAALGAGVARLRRLLLVENLVLTLMGAVLGVIIAIGGVRLLISLAERYSPRANEIRLDGMVLGFTLALSVALALLLSFVASLPKEGTFAASISAGVRRMSGSLSKQRLQRGLVVAQIAVSVVLLAGAGLLTRTMIQLSEVSTGLKTEEVLTMPVPLLVPAKFDAASDAAAKERYDRMRREIRALPGVIEVGVGSTMPLRTTPMQFDVKAEGKPLAVGEAMPRADFRTASPEYFRAAGIPLLKGREFAATDRDGSEQGRDHQPDARRQVLSRARTRSGNGSRGRARCCDSRRSAAIGARSSASSAIRRMAGSTRSPDPWCSCPFAQELAVFGGLVIRADSNVVGAGGGGDAHCPAHRADGSHRECVDRGADQGSECRAPASECRARLVVRHPGGDHRGGGDRRRAGVFGERAHQRDRHPHEPWGRQRPGAADDPEGRGRVAGDWPRAGRDGRLLRRRRHSRTALRCRAARPDHVHRRGGDDGGDRDRRVLDSGASRGADRPGDCDALVSTLRLSHRERVAP